MIVFNFAPIPAPRMSSSDRWKTGRDRRPIVQKYFDYKDKIRAYCAVNGYQLEEVLDIEFIVPMPPSWSKKKREQMNGKPHQQRPDVDNFCKAFMDAFKIDDGFVYDLRARKYWGEEGKIIIHGH